MRDKIGNPTVTPSDERAECALLAMIIADNARIEMLADLEAGDFFDPVNRSIFEVAQSLRSEDRPINLVTIKHTMHAYRMGDGRDVVDYIKGIQHDDEVVSVVDLGKTVRDLSVRRQIMVTAQGLTEMAQNYTAPLASIVAEGVRGLDTIGARVRDAKGKTLWSMAEVIDAYAAQISSGEVPDTIASGLADLDAMTGAFRPGEYWLLAGRPSMGKTALALSQALGAARTGRGVLKFSLEMSAMQLAARAASEQSRRVGDSIPYTDAVAHNLSMCRKEALVRNALALRDVPMMIDDQAGLTTTEIEARIRKQKTKNQNLGLVIVDHIGKIKPSAKYSGNRVNEITEISNHLSEIAKNEKICMLVLSQLNRKVEERDNKRPGLSDLRDSGSLEQDADVVMFAFRPAYYLERAKHDAGSSEEDLRIAQLAQQKNILEVSVAKNRNGKTGTVDLYCEMDTNYVASLGGSNGR